MQKSLMTSAPLRFFFGILTPLQLFFKRSDPEDFKHVFKSWENPPRVLLKNRPHFLTCHRISDQIDILIKIRQFLGFPALFGFEVPSKWSLGAKYNFPNGFWTKAIQKREHQPATSFQHSNRNCFTHSMEIYGIYCQANFTWNQFGNYCTPLRMWHSWIARLQWQFFRI